MPTDASPVDINPVELAQQAADYIAAQTNQKHHDVAIVLGSGWSGGADQLGELSNSDVKEIASEDIPGFSAPVVAGHGGSVRSIECNGKRVLVFGSRIHYYEKRGLDAVAHPVRTAAATGCKTLILTNACGGLDPKIAVGTPVLIRDHLNLTGQTPLTGATFVDMTNAYSKSLRALAKTVDPSLIEGVYAQFWGPQYETPAEVKMAGIMGADLVGMSTTLETIMARSLGIEVLGMSLVSNVAAGILDQPLDHQEVIQAGKDAGPRLAKLLAEVTTKICQK